MEKDIVICGVESWKEGIPSPLALVRLAAFVFTEAFEEKFSLNVKKVFGAEQLQLSTVSGTRRMAGLQREPCFVNVLFR